MQQNRIKSLHHSNGNPLEQNRRWSNIEASSPPIASCPTVGQSLPLLLLLLFGLFPAWSNSVKQGWATQMKNWTVALIGWRRLSASLMYECDGCHERRTRICQHVTMLRRRTRAALAACYDGSGRTISPPSVRPSVRPSNEQPTHGAPVPLLACSSVLLVGLITVCFNVTFVSAAPTASPGSRLPPVGRSSQSLCLSSLGWSCCW